MAAEFNDFQATQPMVFAPFAGESPRAASASQTLALRFIGSGSEYFRIWIVNLLLTLLTLTLYWPFARARRIAYFQNNTLVDDDPLGFHADPWKMFRGYLLMLALGIAYWAVSNFVPALAWLPILVLAALWPMLWRASLQFRLRNTSWRGVRLDFLGDTRGAYLSMLPLFVPGLLLVLLAPAMLDGTPVDAEAGQVFAAVTGGVMLIFALTLPWLMARIKAYQHGGYAFAQQRTELTVGAARFYGMYTRVGLVSLGSLLLGAAGLGVLVFALVSMGGVGAGWGPLAVLIPFALILIYLFVPLFVVPYVATRLQNLLWNHTRSEDIEFQSTLRFGDMFRVNLVNWLLIVLTLGLYWPFAKVRMARLKLEAVSLETHGSVDDWVAQAPARSRGVIGDAAGDFFGIDMGL